MAEELKDKIEVTLDPTGEVVSPVPAGEIEPPVVSAPTEEDQELAELQREYEEAKTPEEKAAKKAKQDAAFAKSRRALRQAEERERKAIEEAAYQKGRAEALAFKPPGEVKPPDLPEIPAPVLPPKPRKEDFKGEDDYPDEGAFYEALTLWVAETTLAKERHKQEQERTKQEYERNMQVGQDYVAKINAKHPDYQDLSRNIRMPDLVAGAIMQTGEIGVDVAYHLAKNPAELLRISHLPPIGQIVEIGQLAMKLSAPSIQPRTISSAPAPIQPIIPSGATTVLTEGMTTEEYIAEMDRREFGERKRE